MFHAAKSSQMQYITKFNKIYNFNNETKNALEVRLEKAPHLQVPKPEPHIGLFRLERGPSTLAKDLPWPDFD